MHKFIYHAPCCSLLLQFNDQHQLQKIDWLQQQSITQPKLTGQWAHKLDAYFAGELQNFDYPPSSAGTPFQQKVWQAIAQIPYGKVASYGDIARIIGSAPRAIGQACGRNPLPIIIPCHRVVSAQGLGGFSLGKRDFELSIKRWLLSHERAIW
ncbi:MAG: methylated-DNA--[protein]-cysteine S-methyltransferase [Snodgrassella sp.]|jgi:methylated-DNA-[protein]-cysteine S-methyltransferase|nr:methylated-DNA--[protein]-cysteine S-methyltransferase [Snodgrassella sp.]